MRKTILCGLVLAVAAVPAGAEAKKKDKPDKKGPYACTPKSVGYNAKGAFVSGEVVQTAGEDTKKRGDDRYSGDIVVDVKKANHRGLKGEQTVSLVNARVKFQPRNDADVEPGDRVKVKGKLTRQPRKCGGDFEPVMTAKRANFKAAKAEKDKKNKKG